jgi:transcriptional regulator with XRE-family HTH domain
MSILKTPVTPEQIRQAAKDLDLTVAAIADGTGLSKAYISEFRNETRNLSQSQQTQLRSFLEAKYKEQGKEFPEAEDTSSNDLLQGLGGMIKRITRPAILLSDDIPKELSEKLLGLIETNRIKVGDILGREFQDGGFFGGDFSKETEEAIRELFALLALNYVAILMLQGRNIARKVSAEYPINTMGDWLSKHLSTSQLGSLLPSEGLENSVKTAKKISKEAV